MHEATVNEFPFVAELPKREKSKLTKIWEQFQELSTAQEEHGILLPQVFVASMLGLSRQRVNEICKDGRLVVVQIGGRPFVTENSVIEFARTERKTGRPCNLPTTNKEIWKRSMDSAKGRVK